MHSTDSGQFQRDWVTLVLDRDYGAKLGPQSALGPIWVVRSDLNAAAMAGIQRPGDYTGDWLTIFNASDDVVERVAMDMLDTVDLHHAGWTTLELVGVQPSQPLLNALRQFGEGTVEETLSGFVFSRARVGS